MQKKSSDEYYKPAEDTFFLSDNIQNEKGDAALDIGTGSGFLVKVLSENFGFVVSTDINFNALKHAQAIVKNCICCNAADTLNCNFDLVVCNLPYLPSEQIDDCAVDGMMEGLGVATNIIQSASKVIWQNGKLVYLTSTLAHYQELVRRTESLGFSVKIIARKKLFFEELVLVECIKL